MRKTTWLVWLMVLSSSLAPLAAEFYVSPLGDDADAGSNKWECSWQTIRTIDVENRLVYMNSPCRYPVGRFGSQMRYRVENIPGPDTPTPKPYRVVVKPSNSPTPPTLFLRFFPEKCGWIFLTG